MNTNGAVRIAGTGIYRPALVDNDFFQKTLGLEVKEPVTRAHAGPGDSSVAMGAAAVRAALEDAQVAPEDVDLLVCFSGMGDFEFPKDANAVQKAAGLDRVSCWSIDTACASFISGMKCAWSQLATGLHKRALVLNVMNWVGRGIDRSKDYSSIGDGAAAVLLERVDDATEPDSLLSARESTRGDFFDFIVLPAPYATGDFDETFSFSQDSKHGRFLASGSLGTARETIEAAGLAPEDIDWFIAHQPGERMLKIWAKALGIAPEKILHTYSERGNMSAVNIPTTLHEFTKTQPKIERGDRLLFFAPGAGLHVAAMCWRY